MPQGRLGNREEGEGRRGGKTVRGRRGGGKREASDKPSLDAFDSL